jgi:hypothetical protein
MSNPVEDCLPFHLGVYTQKILPIWFEALASPIPDTFAHVHVPEGMGFASTACWKRLPWEE